jgi:hypothetical protein
VSILYTQITWIINPFTGSTMKGDSWCYPLNKVMGYFIGE